MRKPSFSERGGWWVAGQMCLMLAVGVLGWIFHPGNTPLAFLWGGAFLLILGAVVGVAGAGALGRNLTSYPQPPPEARLVQSGVYARMRHPLYTSVLALAFGWSLVRISWPAFAASLALALFLDAKARREERWLRSRFPEYDAYARRVKRFIPRVY